MDMQTAGSYIIFIVRLSIERTGLGNHR